MTHTTFLTPVILRPAHALVLAVIALFMAGCGGGPSPVTLAPAPDITVETVGRGETVALSVIDARDRTDIGAATPAFGDARPIATSEDVAVVLREHIAEGLTAMGFSPAPGDTPADRRLTVRLEEFSYGSESALVTSRVSVQSAVAVEAEGPQQKFQGRYRQESDDRVAFSPSAAGRADAVNTALESLIEKVFSDRDMARVLAGR